MFKVLVVSPKFEGVNLVKQHRYVPRSDDAASVMLRSERVEEKSSRISTPLCRRPPRPGGD